MKHSPILFRLLALLAITPFAIGASKTVTITTLTLPNGTGGTPYSATITAAGGCQPYQWATIGTLPPGVAATAGKTTATFSGTPSAAGTFTFGVSVKGCGGHVATANYTVVIQSAANHIVTLSWNSGSSSNIAGYNLYRAASASGPFALVNASLIPSTLYTDSSVANNTQYFYQVTAVNTSNEESLPSAQIQVGVPY